MGELTEKFYSAIEKLIHIFPADIDDRSRKVFYFIFLIIGPPLMITFGVNGLINGDWFLFSFLMVLTFGIITGWIYLLKSENGVWAYRINAFVYTIVLVHILYIGGQDGSKILWSYTLPLITTFLLGKREGTAWCLIYLGIAVFLMFSPGEWPDKYIYHPQFKLRFIVTYTIVAAITYWFEYLRHDYRNKLEHKNKKLERQIIYNKKIQKELEANEELFRSIFDQAGVGVSLTCSKTGKLLKVNKKYSEILQYSADELENITWQSITHPDDIELDLKNLKDLRNGEIEFYSMEKRHIGRDESIIWVNLSVSPIPGKNQHIGVIQDITARKSLEKEVQTLEGIIPICSQCKKIRDDEGYWNRIESYIQAHSEASFSHGMCPECMDKFYGKEDWYHEMKKEKGEE